MRDKDIGLSIISQISHELQTPAAIVRGNIDLIIPHLPSSRKRVFNMARKSIERASGSISHLLRLAKMHSMIGGMKLRPLPLDEFLMELVMDARRATNGSIKLFCSKRAVALADKEFIREVLMNLIINSNKHSNRSSRIVVRARRSRSGVVISITDNGGGIPRSVIKNIFNPWFSGSSSSGVGLGLTICKQIIEGHGGEIVVKSRVGKGTTFIVKLLHDRMD